MINVYSNFHFEQLLEATQLVCSLKYIIKYDYCWKLEGK